MNCHTHLSAAAARVTPSASLPKARSPYVSRCIPPAGNLSAFSSKSSTGSSQNIWKPLRNRPVSGLTDAQRSALTRRYIDAAKEYFPERAAYFRQFTGGTYNRITIRDQKTRWGSCSARGTLSFNWRLMLAPPAILDYVVVHELCHLTHMDHSAAFWQAVEAVYPDYRSARKWLKEHGQELVL